MHFKHEEHIISAMMPRQYCSPIFLTIVAAFFVHLTNGHTWVFTKGRATMQASLDKPFRDRITEGGQVGDLVHLFGKPVSVMLQSC